MVGSGWGVATQLQTFYESCFNPVIGRRHPAVVLHDKMTYFLVISNFWIRPMCFNTYWYIENLILELHIL
jgi:hypothetical protein